jgi:hypothetical protein
MCNICVTKECLPRVPYNADFKIRLPQTKTKCVEASSLTGLDSQV